MKTSDASELEKLGYAGDKMHYNFTLLLDINL